MGWGIEQLNAGVTGTVTGRVTGLESGRVHTVGRDGLNHLVVDNRSVSNRHAELVAGPHGIEVRDSPLKPPTRVRGELLDGGCAVARAGDEIRFASTAFRVVSDAPPPGDFWHLEAALDRVDRAYASIQWKQIWTRWWRGFDGRPIKGQFGDRGASFWLRRFARKRRSWVQRTGDWGWLDTDEPDALLTPAQVASIVEIYRHGDGYGMVAYLAQQLIGASALISIYDTGRGSPSVEQFDWLSEFEPDDDLIAYAQRLGGEEAYALLLPMLGHVEAARLVPTDGRHLALNSWAASRGATDRELFELAIDGHQVRDDFVARFAESATDSEWRALVATMMERNDYDRQAAAMAARPVVDVLEDFVLRADEFTWSMGDWVGGLAERAAPGLNRAWRNGDVGEQRRVVQAVGMMPERSIRLCWESLDSDLKTAVVERFGPWLAEPPRPCDEAELPDCLLELREVDTVPDRAFRPNDDTPWKELDLPGAPTVWTRDGRALPRDVVRGVVASRTIRGAEWGRSDDWEATYEADLRWPPKLAWAELVEPRSSFRFWWYLHSVSPTLLSWHPESWSMMFVDDATVARELMEHPTAQIRSLRNLGASDEVEPLYSWWRSNRDGRDLLEQLGRLRDDLEANLPRHVPTEALPMADAWVASYVKRSKRFELGTLREWRRERPWIREALSNVVWQTDFAGGRTYFWWAHEGEMVDLEHEVVKLPDDASVWVTRGDAMPPEERTRWATLLADHEVLQAVDQLAEPHLNPDIEAIAGAIGGPIDLWDHREEWDYDFGFTREHYPEGGATARLLDFGVWGGVRLVIEGDYSSPSRQLITVDFLDEHGESISLEEAPAFVVSVVASTLAD